MKFSCLFPRVKSVKFPTRITGQLRDYVPHLPCNTVLCTRHPGDTPATPGAATAFFGGNLTELRPAANRVCAIVAESLFSPVNDTGPGIQMHPRLL